ncbi:pyruvate formate lyase family protein [Desulfobacula sp.]|uniref:pyruvate formate lyase family protein n=1 Tax=Desulfobacula sp. TaxID=2593537 RepID=UPI00260F4B68|nr:pyruvate formate lyase family protein [Desulfobacula sp.]
MNKRVQRLKDRLDVEKYPLCIEKFRIATQVLANTQGEPNIIRRGKIIAGVLNHITIFIEEDEPFVGAGASKPFGMEIDYEYGTWTQDEIDALKNEHYVITPEDEAELQIINAQFKEKTLVEAMGDVFFESERLWPLMKSGVILPPWKGKKVGSGGGYAQSGLGLGPGFFLLGVDYSRMLNDGSLKIIADAEEELKNLRYFASDCLEKKDFLTSVILVHKALINFSGRYAQLAETMANQESDPTRKNELLKIADTCKWVPAKPARHFFDALQSFWFTFLLISPSPTSAAGRFDQYMYPFYKRDKEQGRITDEEVLELLECLRIKDIKMNRVSGQQNRKKNSGMAKWHNWTIGGVTVDGRDASNELTYLLMKAAKDTQIPHHTLTLRVHDDTPDDVMIKALEVVKTGLGMPAFVSDRSYVDYFMRNGMSLEDAREYIMTGCLDGNIPGKSRNVAVGMVVIPLIFEIFMHNGVNPGTGEKVGMDTGDPENMTSFDEFLDAFHRQLKYILGLVAEKSNIELVKQRELFSDPFRSSLMYDAIKEGKDILSRKMPFENASVQCLVGTINAVDSLAAVKKLVFEEKKVSMKQLKAALDANWQGAEDLHKLFLGAPKYGNDDDYVDLMAADLYKFIERSMAEFDTVYGGKVTTTAISISSHQPGGALTGATPDGRCKGDILADGSMSPMQGMDKKGPTAILKSAGKIDQAAINATLLNMKFHPSALKTTQDLMKLSALIKTYFKMGGKHVQFNVVDSKLLKEAQKLPDRHKELVVRVAGYSAHFVALDKPVQDEVIARTELGW